MSPNVQTGAVRRASKRPRKTNCLGGDALTAFQAYTGDFTDDGETYRWNCYATCPVYEVRSHAHPLPEPSNR